MSAAAKALVVVSFYDARPRLELDALLGDLATVDAGATFDTLVVVNQAAAGPTPIVAPLRGLRVLHRPNTGYNIGAWDHGWRESRGYDAYVFLQHECRLRRPGWLAAYLRRLAEPGVGLVGERANPAWAKPWPELERRFAGHTLPDHGPDGAPAERLPTYRACWRRWGIDPGERGDHLQTLVLAARDATMARIDGFPVGGNYGEAIAAEIGVSKRVQALGLTTEEIGPRPFTWITHPQWQDKAAAHPAPSPRTSLQRWLEERRDDAGFADGPWLVLGKGPTFRMLTAEHRATHRLFALNHVVRETAVDVAHAIDVDVAQSCRAALASNCRWLVMPRVPHVGDKPGDKRLEEWFEEIPELWELERQGRLVWYNCSTARAFPGSPVIEVEHFSSEAAFGVLGLLGCRTVRTLGVDGGRQYAPAFDDLAETTRLRNGQALFDRQFARLREVAAAHGMEWQPLAPVMRIAIRRGPGPSLAALVLEHTLRRHASRPLEIVHLAPAAPAPSGAQVVDEAGLAVADPATGASDASTGGWFAAVAGAPWRDLRAEGAAAWLDAFADAVAARSIDGATVRAAVRSRQAHPDLLRPEGWPAIADETATLRRTVAALLLSPTWRLGERIVRPLAAALRLWRRRVG